MESLVWLIPALASGSRRFSIRLMRGKPPPSLSEALVISHRSLGARRA